jgi:hypothetical protein
VSCFQWDILPCTTGRALSAYLSSNLPQAARSAGRRSGRQRRLCLCQ